MTPASYWRDLLARHRNDGSCEKEILAALAKADGPLGPHTGPSSPGSEPTPQPPHTERDGGETLIERLDKAIEGIQPLTGQSEDNIWRPANKAWEAMVAAREFLAAQPTPPGPVAGWSAEPADAERLLAALGRPRRYDHRYADPGSGNPVWRSESGLWNGQQSSAAVPLYDFKQIWAALSALPPEPPVESGED